MLTLNKQNLEDERLLHALAKRLENYHAGKKDNSHESITPTGHGNNITLIPVRLSQSSGQT